jgi:hypothetical protein
MFLDDALLAQYHRDGYVLLENVFSEREVAAMRTKSSRVSA